MYMPKRTERSILIDELLILIENNELTPNDLLDKTNIRRLSHRARNYITNSQSSDYEQEIGSALRYMRHNQLILLAKYDYLSVTNKAIKRLERLAIEHLFVYKPSKWDGKWRFVVFEIPSKDKVYKDALVSKIKLMGFKRLQDSVYVIPYRCQKQVSKLIDFYQFKYHVFYLEVIHTNNDNVLRRLFPEL